ncbi:hypothetical protein HDV00_002982 [Rhizophlyctis rosea]|nr:hypothetical protein HDV00_002982 [Rhizophlyctis rosea]
MELSMEEWDYLMDAAGLYKGTIVGEDGVSRPGGPPVIERPPAKPCFTLWDNAEVEVVTTHSEQERRNNVKEDTKSESRIHCNALYKFLRVTVYFGKDDRRPSEKFQNAIDSALAHPERQQQLEAVSQVLDEFGHLFSTEVQLGGMLTTTKETVIKSVAEQKKVEDSLRVGFDFSNSVAKLGTGIQCGSVEELTESEQSAEKRATFKAKGGNTLLVTNVNDWIPTVGDYRNWRVIGTVSQIPTYHLLDPERVATIDSLLEANTNADAATTSTAILPPSESAEGMSRKLFEGCTIVSGFEDGTAGVWDVVTGSLRKPLDGHTKTLNSVAISSNGKIIVTGFIDGTAKVWDTATGKLLKTLKGHRDAITSVAVDGNAKVWDLATGKLVRTLKQEQGKYTLVAISTNGLHLVTCSGDWTSAVGIVKLCDLVTGRVVRTLEGPSLSVVSVAISGNGKVCCSGFFERGRHDGTRIATGSLDGTAKLWNMARGPEPKALVETGSATEDKQAFENLLKTFLVHESGVSSVAISGDGTHVVTGSQDGVTNIWDAITGTLVKSVFADRGAVYSVAVASCPSGSG